MKSTICTLALATLVAIASLSPAHAQTLASRVDVPFPFDCGSAHFSPGSYTLSTRNLGSQKLLAVWDGKMNRQFVINAGDGPRNTAPAFVVFRKYGSRYFLAGYHPSNSASTMEMPASKQERIVAGDYAAYLPEHGRVQLALIGVSVR
jgi:hypothetical protein